MIGRVQWNSFEVGLWELVTNSSTSRFEGRRNVKKRPNKRWKLRVIYLENFTGNQESMSYIHEYLNIYPGIEQTSTLAGLFHTKVKSAEKFSLYVHQQIFRDPLSLCLWQCDCSSRRQLLERPLVRSQNDWRVGQVFKYVSYKSKVEDCPTSKRTEVAVKQSLNSLPAEETNDHIFNLLNFWTKWESKNCSLSINATHAQFRQLHYVFKKHCSVLTGNNVGLQLSNTLGLFLNLSSAEKALRLLPFAQLKTDRNKSRLKANFFLNLQEMTDIGDCRTEFEHNEWMFDGIQFLSLFLLTLFKV